jgi:hypothetical protein
VDLAAESARRSVGQWAQIEEVAADRCRLRLTVDNLDWTALALGSLGAEFEIVNPPGIARAGPRMGESLRSCETRLKRVIAPEGATRLCED